MGDLLGFITTLVLFSETTDLVVVSVDLVSDDLVSVDLVSVDLVSVDLVSVDLVSAAGTTRSAPESNTSPPDP